MDPFLQGRFDIEQTFHQFLADDVAFHDLFGIFRLDLHIEHVVGHDLDDRALRAETEAAGLDHAHVVFQPVFLDVFAQVFHHFLRIRCMAARSSAAEDVFLLGIEIMFIRDTEHQFAFGSVVSSFQGFPGCNLIHFAAASLA